MDASDAWRRCNSCKKPIAFGVRYWVCNVSTCNRKRTGLVFCNVSCWDAHLPLMNHRDSWARDEWARIQSGEDKPARARKASVTADPAPTPPRPESLAPKTIIRRSKPE
jgi:hypothetical protein